MTKIVIELNGLKEEIPTGLSISKLIVHFKEGDPDLIVEKNGKYIYPKDYISEYVENNDIIEFVNPNLGG